MCVIIGGIRKNLKREEQIQGMKSNSSGFYVAVLRMEAENRRKIVEEIRTLKQDEAMAIWDKALPDDIVITHSRIPSHGPLTLDNVHGWECEGVRFMHNGTMSNIADVMSKDDTRTDSEFFFKELFIPLWKSQGRNFNPLVELVINSVRGSSRFCFIMPDGHVKVYGDYVKDHECWFSNRSYVVPTYTGGSDYSGYGYGYGYGYGGYGQRGGRTDAGTGTTVSGFGDNGRGVSGVSRVVGVGGGGVTAEETAGETVVDDTPDAGEVLRELVGDNAGLAKLALSHIVCMNLHDLVLDELGDTGCDTIEDPLTDILPAFISTDDNLAYSPMHTFRRWLTGARLTDPDIANFLEEYSGIVEESIFDGYTTNQDPELMFKSDASRIRAALRLYNTSFDWSASKLKKLVTSWKSVTNRKHQFKMVERTPEELFWPFGGSYTKVDWYEYADNLALLLETVKKGTPKW